MTRSVAGKSVLITGAARGIGATSARLLAAKGARLALVGLEPDRLEALAAELGPGHVWFAADVTKQEDVEAAVQGAVDALGGLDVVVANAGIASNGTVLTTPVEAMVRVVDVNLNGVIRTVHAALPHVIARKGYVMVVSSAAAFTVLPGLAAYHASKAGAEQIANALRLEVAHRGVKVGSVHPCWIDTDLVRDAESDSATFKKMRSTLPGALGSTTTVEKCAEAVVDGIERRKRKVYVPRSLAIYQALRSLIVGPIGDLVIKPQAKSSVPKVEQEARERGRAFGRTAAGVDDVTSEKKTPASVGD